MSVVVSAGQGAQFRYRQQEAEWRGETLVNPRCLDRDLLFRLQGGRCYLCGRSFGRVRGQPTFDHVVPRARGGQDADNRLLAHLNCNEGKGNDEPRPCELIYLAAITAMAEAADA